MGNLYTRMIPAHRGSTTVVLVLALSGILLIGALSTFFTGRQYRTFQKKSHLSVQAFFMAQACLQHAELKIRFFPTELYDASEYSLGKNPYFDFSEITSTDYSKLAAVRKLEYKPSNNDPANYYMHIACSFNPGPRFLSEGGLSTTESWFQLSALDPKDSSPANFSAKEVKWFPQDGWPVIDGIEVPNSDLYLWKFAFDITNRKKDNGDEIQPTLTCTRSNNFNIGVQNAIPYTGLYETKKIQVLSMKEHRRLNQEAVKIVAVGKVVDPISGETAEEVLEKIIKVSRK